ncbi:hypothetical protein H311_02430 [Anncaliia algerae PRA109]|nr:hypothetical protein H311_02430 [Anncaliia algerae PRA109]
MKKDSYFLANITLILQQYFFIIIFCLKEYIEPTFPNIKHWLANKPISDKMLNHFLFSILWINCELIISLFVKWSRSNMLKRFFSFALGIISFVISCFCLIHLIRMQDNKVISLLTYFFKINGKGERYFHILNSILDVLIYVFSRILTDSQSNQIIIKFCFAMGVLILVTLAYCMKFSNGFLLFFILIKLLYYNVCYKIANNKFPTILYLLILVQFFLIIFLGQYLDQIIKLYYANTLVKTMNWVNAKFSYFSRN